MKKLGIVSITFIVSALAFFGIPPEAAFESEPQPEAISFGAPPQTDERKETVQANTENKAKKPAPLETPVVEASEKKILKNAEPVELWIPSIKLNAAIKPVGLDAEGRMDVPSGKTKNVGWYKYGTIPGEQGSAVLAAHVFAAFSNLDEVKKGSNIYVVSKDNKKLHFKVEETKLYRLQELKPEWLFNRNDSKRLTLITCAGKKTRDGSTYTHRFVVYATLVEEN